MSEHHVISPLPGVMYRRPSPDEPPYVNDGDVVTTDQTVCLVEIMKQFTQVAAGAAGIVTSFAIEDGAMLFAGDVIATIETDGVDA